MTEGSRQLLRESGSSGAGSGERSRVSPEDLDLRALWARLVRGRRIIAASVAVSTTVFALVAFIMTPVYRATTVLTPANLSGAPSKNSALGALGLLGGAAGLSVRAAGTDTAEALAVLRSREFTEAFIREAGLMQYLYSRRWDAQRKEWKGTGADQPTIAQALKYFNKQRVVTEDKLTGLYSVQVEWRDPVQAALWANELVARLNDVMRKRAITRTSAYLDYLQKELTSTQGVETRGAIARLIEEQINERMLANVTPEYSFRVVDRALVPDKRDPVRPRKPLLLMLGAITGAFVGVVAVFVLAPWLNGVGK